MTALAIVQPRAIINHTTSRVGVRVKHHHAHLRFKRREETLPWGVSPTVPFAAHTGLYLRAGKEGLLCGTCVLASAIPVMHESPRWLTAVTGVLEGGQHERTFQACCHRPAHHPTPNRSSTTARYNQPARVGTEVLSANHVGGGARLEVPRQPVRRNRVLVATIRGANLAPPLTRGQGGVPHQTRHARATASLILCLKHSMDARTAIGRAAVTKMVRICVVSRASGWSWARTGRRFQAY
jgi:hypothetical protein